MKGNHSILNNCTACTLYAAVAVCKCSINNVELRSLKKIIMGEINTIYNLNKAVCCHGGYRISHSSEIWVVYLNCP